MVETDFKVQKGLEVVDGNVMVKGSASPDGDPSGSGESTVFAKMFDTSPDNDTTSHIEMSGTNIAVLGSATNIDMTVTPKGTGVLDVVNNGMEGKIGQTAQYDAKFTTLLAKGAVSLGEAGVDSTITQVTAGVDAAGRSMTITAGSALAGNTNNTGIGGNLILQAGAGKGQAAGGSILFEVASAGGDTNTLNSIDDTALTLASDLKATFGGDVYIGGRDLFLQNSATNTGKLTSTDSLLTLTHTATNGDIAITPTGTGDLDLFTDTIDLGKATPTNTAITVRPSAVNTDGRNLTITSGSTTGGSGLDDTGVGGDLLLQAGAGKGDALGGSIIFNVANTDAGSGTVLNSINDEALRITSNKRSTFKGAIGVASDLDSNITTDGMFIYEHTPSTNKHLRIRNNYQSDSIYHNIYIEPNRGDTSSGYLGETYINSPLQLADFNLKRVDTAYAAKLEGNTNISGYSEKMSIASNLGLTVGGSAIANDTIAMQVNGGANDAIGGSGSNAADYTEVRIHVGVNETAWNNGDTTWDEELATLVIENSSNEIIQGSRGMVLSNGVSHANAGAWAIGTSRDTFGTFMIGSNLMQGKGWDGLKGSVQSPFETARGADTQNQPYMTLTHNGSWEVQIGSADGTASGGYTYHPGSFTFLRGGAHRSIVQKGLALVPHTQTSSTNPVTDFDIRIYDTGTGDEYTGFKAPATIASSHVYTLPAALPGSSKVLQSTSAGVMSWVDQSGGTSVNGTPNEHELALWHNSDTLKSDSELTYDGDTLKVEESAALHSAPRFQVTQTKSGNTASSASALTKGAKILAEDTASSNHADSIPLVTALELDATSAAPIAADKIVALDLNASGGTNNYAIYSYGGDAYFKSSVDNKPPVLTLEHNYADAAGAELKFNLNRGVDGVDGDTLGKISFYGNDDGTPTSQAFAHITAKSTDTASGSEKGEMNFSVATTGSGALEEVVRITGGAAAASSTMTVFGNLDVQGELVTLNNTETIVEDKSLVVGVAGGMEEATYARSSTTVTVTSASHGFSNSEYVYISNAGNGIADGVYQVSNVATDTFDFTGGSGTVSAGAPIFHSSADVTEATAADSGLHIPGTSLHSMTYNATHGFRFTDDLDIGSGKHFSINGDTMLTHTALNMYGNSALNTDVLTWNTLGSTVTNSSLTGLGTVTSGQLGTSSSPLTAHINAGSITGVTVNATSVQSTSVSVDAVAILDTTEVSPQTISGTTTTTLAEFPFATYRTVKYCGHILKSSGDSNADDVDSFEVLISYKGTSATDIVPIFTVYAYMNSAAAPLGTLSVAATDPGSTGTNTHVALQFTPVASGATFSWALASTMLIKQDDMT